VYLSTLDSGSSVNRDRVGVLPACESLDPPG